MSSSQLRTFEDLLILQHSSSGAGHEQEGKDHAGDEAANVVPDADPWLREAEDEVEAEPEEPVHDGSLPKGSQGATVDDVEGSQGTEDAEDSSRSTGGEGLGS